MATSSVWAQGTPVRLTSLEWPPYAGMSLPGQGAAAVVAREAFKAMGYTLQVEFYPWSRAVKMVQQDERYHGYFPEYLSAQVAARFNCVGSLGEGPLGFAQRRSASVVWNRLEDLQGLRLGVVQDYVNTAEFDDRVARKLLQVDVAPTDSSNLLKLAASRIDLAVIDRNVFSYLMATQPALQGLSAALEFNPHILEPKKLYICFRQGPEGAKLARALEKGLMKIDVADISTRYLQGLVRKTGWKGRP